MLVEDRLARGRVDAEPGPVAVAVDLLVRDRALEHEDERVELAAPRRRTRPARSRRPSRRRAAGCRARSAACPGIEPRSSPRGSGSWPPSSRPTRRRSRGRSSSRARGRAASRCWPWRAVNSIVRVTAAPPRGRPRPRRCARGAVGRARPGARRACRAGASSPAWPVTRPACRQPRERVRDRRPLGADEPAEQPVGERQRRGGCRPARRGPSARRGASSSSVRRTSSRGWHVIARCTLEIAGAPRRPAAEQRVRDLRPRPHPLGERLVEQREPCRHERPPAPICARAGRRCRRSQRLQQVARADELGGGAVADARVDREHAVEHEHPEPVAGSAANHARESHSPAGGVEHARGRHLAGDDAACAGRAPGPGRRRGRAGSGTTTVGDAGVDARRSAARPVTRPVSLAVTRAPLARPRWTSRSRSILRGSGRV